MEANLIGYGPGDEVTWGPVSSKSDPRWVDDSEEAGKEALEQSKDEHLGTPWLLADWLIDQDLSERPICWHDATRALERGDSLSISQILVLVMNGTNEAANSARFLLRDRFLADKRISRLVENRADELTPEVAAQLEQDRRNDTWGEA